MTLSKIVFLYLIVLCMREAARHFQRGVHLLLKSIINLIHKLYNWLNNNFFFKLTLFINILTIKGFNHHKFKCYSIHGGGGGLEPKTTTTPYYIMLYDVLATQT